MLLQLQPAGTLGLGSHTLSLHIREAMSQASICCSCYAINCIAILRVPATLMNVTSTDTFRLPIVRCQFE